jgi:hypothetical protein
MRTLIHTGIISSIAVPTNVTRARAFSSMSFSLGEPPVTFYIPGGAGYVPFRGGDFVAIAGRKTFMPGVQWVALAYRRLGVEGPGRGIGYMLPLACLGFGVLGLYFAYLGALSDANGRNVFVPMLVLGAFGLFRLIAIRAAARQLDSIEMPLTTRSSGP